MKIVVIGGTGLIGSQLVNVLKERGNDVVAASPNTGVNTLTGEGLANALKDAHTVIDVSNSASFEDNAVMNFFKTSNENLLAAEKTAGVKHHIALSVVGTQKLQGSGYFRAKQVQEDLIKASSIPYTIVHATQFFEFAGSLALMSTIDGKVVVPDANVQPIASKDVVAFMAEKAVEPAANTILEIGGPDKIALSGWIGHYAKTTGKNYEVIVDTNGQYSGTRLTKDALVPEKAVWLGSENYKDWIANPANQR
ncbi:MAG: SDR family oxidoreductase [Chitinophagaceae bacterium]|nr:MAG: SDR family oxidoreductase [Chitinophagaceae bacterium]